MKKGFTGLEGYAFLGRCAIATLLLDLMYAVYFQQHISWQLCTLVAFTLQLL